MPHSTHTHTPGSWQGHLLYTQVGEPQKACSARAWSASAPFHTHTWGLVGAHGWGDPKRSAEPGLGARVYTSALDFWDLLVCPLQAFFSILNSYTASEQQRAGSPSVPLPLPTKGKVAKKPPTPPCHSCHPWDISPESPQPDRVQSFQTSNTTSVSPALCLSSLCLPQLTIIQLLLSVSISSLGDSNSERVAHGFKV